MYKQLATRLLGGLALLFLCGNFTSTAHAYFQIKYDFGTPDNLPEWGWSEDRFYVYAKINNSWIQVDSLRQLNPTPGSGWGAFGISQPWTAKDVQAIAIEVTGFSFDALWIDRLALADSNGTIVSSWGADNLIGYCFSADPSDGNNPWCWNNRAYTSITFNR